MKYAPKVLVALFIATLLLLVTPSCAGAGRASPPGPPGVRSLPHASPAYMAWALSWYRADQRWRRADNLVRPEFGLHTLRGVAKPPRILAYPSEWRAAALRWREQGIARCAEYQRLWHKLIAPARPYTAVSWWPLAHYLGWPAWTRSTWIHVVTGESHGQPGAIADPYNPRSATGLMQICPGGRRFLNVITNIKAGLTKFIAAHYTWAPWAATAY